MWADDRISEISWHILTRAAYVTIITYKYVKIIIAAVGLDAGATLLINHNGLNLTGEFLF